MAALYFANRTRSHNNFQVFADRLLSNYTCRHVMLQNRGRKYLFCHFSAYLQVSLAIYNHVTLHGIDVCIRPSYIVAIFSVQLLSKKYLMAY